MNQDLKKKWVDALRSGEYAQTQEVLRDCKGYCCLGVLCDVSGIGEWINKADGCFVYETTTDTEEYRLPLNLYGEVSTRVQNLLTRMNDADKTFHEIADYIETNL